MPPGGPSAATVTESDDVAGDDTTDAVMQVVDVFGGSIDPADDEDWIAVDLTGGEQVQVTLDVAFFGGSIDVHDSDGNVVASSSGGFGSDPGAVLDVPETGTYYVAVSQSRDITTATYSLAVDTYVPPTPLDTIDWGGAVVGMERTDTIQVYFAKVGETFDGITAEDMNAYERG